MRGGRRIGHPATAGRVRLIWRGLHDVLGGAAPRPLKRVAQAGIAALSRHVDAVVTRFERSRVTNVALETHGACHAVELLALADQADGVLVEIDRRRAHAGSSVVARPVSIHGEHVVRDVPTVEALALGEFEALPVLAMDQRLVGEHRLDVVWPLVGRLAALDAVTHEMRGHWTVDPVARGELSVWVQRKPDQTGRGTAFHARFRAYGQRREVLLGYSSEGMTSAIARQELQAILVDVRRGDWKPFSTRAPEEPVQAPTFHEFASEWLAARETSGLRPRSIEYLRWALVEHLLPAFASTRVDAFTIEAVDRYATAKASGGRLSNRSVNKTIDVLSSVLETAVEYEHLRVNPAKGRRRRLPVSKKPRSFLYTAEHIAAVLDAAGALDLAARRRRGQRRALLATLALAGLRIGEALDLRWGDVNLAGGRLKVRDAKTPAGVRTVDLLPVLRDELLAYKAKAADTGPDVLVFGTSTGGRQSETNVRRRILAPAVEKASEALAKAEAERLPERLTPHSLRRTFASILAALGSRCRVSSASSGTPIRRCASHLRPGHGAR